MPTPTFSSTHQPTRRGNRRDSSYDLDALHQLLWMRANTRGRLTILAATLGEELDVGLINMRRLLDRLVRDGKIRKLERDGMNGMIYSITDPAVTKSARL